MIYTKLLNFDTLSASPLYNVECKNGILSKFSLLEAEWVSKINSTNLTLFDKIFSNLVIHFKKSMDIFFKITKKKERS